MTSLLLRSSSGERCCTRREESRYPQDWLRIAQRDLARVERALRDEDWDLAGFCLQQAVEKLLKAFLLAQGWRLRRIHDLEALLQDALLYDPELERFRGACQEITGYYMVERYPMGAEAGITEGQVRQSLDATQELLVRLRPAIG